VKPLCIWVFNTWMLECIVHSWNPFQHHSCDVTKSFNIHVHECAKILYTTKLWCDSRRKKKKETLETNLNNHMHVHMHIRALKHNIFKNGIIVHIIKMSIKIWLVWIMFLLGYLFHIYFDAIFKVFKLGCLFHTYFDVIFKIHIEPNFL